MQLILQLAITEILVSCNLQPIVLMKVIQLSLSLQVN